MQDYQVLNLLGKGGFACVYRARAINTGQEVAIKMVSAPYQALNFREAMEAVASVAPGLGLGAPLKDSHRLFDFLMEVPFTDMEMSFTEDQWPCPFRNEI